MVKKNFLGSLKFDCDTLILIFITFASIYVLYTVCNDSDTIIEGSTGDMPVDPAVEGDIPVDDPTSDTTLDEGTEDDLGVNIPAAVDVNQNTEIKNTTYTLYDPSSKAAILTEENRLLEESRKKIQNNLEEELTKKSINLAGEKENHKTTMEKLEKAELNIAAKKVALMAAVGSAKRESEAKKEAEKVFEESRRREVQSRLDKLSSG